METVSSEPAPAPVRMDGFEMEDYDWEYWGVAQYKHDAPECYLRYHSAAVWEYPPWVLLGDGDLDEAIWHSAISGQITGDQDESPSQQPAGRDSEGERNSLLYGDPWMQQMQGLEQELRATFQKCDCARTNAC